MPSEFMQGLSSYIEKGLSLHQDIWQLKLWEKSPDLIAQGIAENSDYIRSLPAGEQENEIHSLVRDVLAQAKFSGQARAAMRSSVRAYIVETQSFYTKMGIEIKDWQTAIRNHAIFKRALLDFEKQFTSLGEQAQNDLTTMLRRGIARNDDRDKIANELRSYTGKMGVFGRAIAFTAVSGFHQATRQIVAEKAGLEHWYYAGNVMINTRSFCETAVGYMYDDTQIDLMRNAQIEPVRIYKGGYNCRHQLLPVDPAWDKFKTRDKLPALLTDPDEIRAADKAKRKKGK